MAQEYAISETTLTALADAVRKNVGETKLIQTGVGEPEVKISKTTNATSFTEHSGGYGNNKALYDVVSFPGASKIVVDIAYQTESTNYDYVQIAVGSVSSAPSTSTYPKYGGTTLTRKELTFEDTDTITFYFKTDSSTDAYLGYYAECRAYDKEGNIFRPLIYEEVPNTMTVDTMISTINNLSGNITIQSINVADSASTAFQTLTLETDSNKNNIWCISLRPNTDSYYARWMGYPGLIIKLLNQQPYLKLFDGSTGNSYSPWFGSGFTASKDNSLNEDQNGNVILSFNQNVYPAEHNLMWKITF